ncbi:hypothetical protein QAD02_022366 [Eretmocerus hayati]|uniref:Uncharacterized protein n=1 Tax=Eretmocerus hayati TaxID=131215 RepID=A0ACC2PT15_9HYME|nr:hypothetical protein QAD02_022366 [Eretmocerus hayati]
MKSLLSLCLVSCLFVTSLASIVPQINAEDETTSIELTTASAAEDSTEMDLFMHAMGEREPRTGAGNGLLDIIFKFCLDVLQHTFGRIPPMLNSEVVKSLTDMAEGKATPDPIPDEKETTPQETDEGGKLPVDAPPIDTEGPVEVPTPYRRGKPNAAYYAYQDGHKVRLVGRPMPRIYANSKLRKHCIEYLRKGILKRQDRFKINLVGRMCMNVYRKSKKH